MLSDYNFIISQLENIKTSDYFALIILPNIGDDIANIIIDIQLVYLLDLN